MNARVPVVQVPADIEYSNNINRLHAKALALGMHANELAASGNVEAAREAARQAMQAESWAAGLLAGNRDSDPHRALLFLSASRMAFNCGEVFQAKMLATSGLVTHPPAQLAEQLNEIVQQIESQEKAALKASTLSSRSAALLGKQTRGNTRRKQWGWGR